MITLEEKIEMIARICHEANRYWCMAHDDHSQKTWEEAEEWQRTATRVGVEHRLNSPNELASAQHELWMNDKFEHGWVYGEVKDEKNKIHPCLVPYDELSEFEKKKDALFIAVVDALK